MLGVVVVQVDVLVLPAPRPAGECVGIIVPQTDHGGGVRRHVVVPGLVHRTDEDVDSRIGSQSAVTNRGTGGEAPRGDKGIVTEQKQSHPKPSAAACR